MASLALALYAIWSPIIGIIIILMSGGILDTISDDPDIDKKSKVYGIIAIIFLFIIAFGVFYTSYLAFIIANKT